MGKANAKKIIARIKGGLGNQIFCYAAARRLALINKAELVIDDITGFVRDIRYKRRYMLDHFNIRARKATPAERFEPFERCRRMLAKRLSRHKPFENKRYLLQEGMDFDKRLLTLPVRGTLYLDGYWQSEKYFKDAEQIIRDDLRIIAPPELQNQRMAEEINNCQSVALHVRDFDATDGSAGCNISFDYYRRAVALMAERVESPHYFLFSDAVEAARARLDLPENEMRSVSLNRGAEDAYADLWLMSQCKHFITANSTFSWWGAWLSGSKEKIVVAPGLKAEGEAAWGFDGLIPSNWFKV